MNGKLSMSRWIGVAAAGALAAVLSACGGGSNGGAVSPPLTVDQPAPSGSADGAAALAAATSLNVSITAVRIEGKPAVDFTVTNESGKGMTGLAAADLRFGIAKLVPAATGGPANWQSYINRANGGAVQGAQERTTTGYRFGTLNNLGGGKYSYTFATDITDAAANACPAPCTDDAGKPLDLRYDAGLTHRVTIQQANSGYAHASGVFDYVPAGGAPTFRREVVASAACDTCHVQLVAHGTRVDTRLCVTCHNPGSWVAGTPNVTVDFKAMVHRIHNGAALPSVTAGVPYKIGSADYSAAAFPQDVRNCTRCHDGSAGSSIATAQGDNWKAQPSIAACGSCHDNVYFGIAPDPARPYQTRLHSGGSQPDDSGCTNCHAPAKFSDAKNAAVAHGFPARLKAAAAKFQYTIVGVASATAGAKPVVTFSVSDPTSGNAAYDIKTHKAFTAPAGASRLAVVIGWTTADFGNGGSGAAYGQPVSIDALATATAGTAGTWVVTSPVAIPAGQTGTLRVLIEGHPAADLTTAGTFSDRVPVKSVYLDVAIGGGAAVARRTVVDLAKCDVCHDQLSLHGANRNESIGACVVCHNPNATDKARRPAGPGTDGKAEESIDFKTMIHGIHAGQAGKGGARTRGLVVYGFGGSVNDFGTVVFPGRLADCASCHTGDSYRLSGLWTAPTANGIPGTTVGSGASGTDPADNLRNSPIAAVCTSCHDSDTTKAHVSHAVAGGSLGATQAAINAKTENCQQCHGVGVPLDVKTAHGVK